MASIARYMGHVPGMPLDLFDPREQLVGREECLGDSGTAVVVPQEEEGAAYASVRIVGCIHIPRVSVSSHLYKPDRQHD